MAIFLEGLSQCALCLETIETNDAFVMFPAFVHNMKDELFIFSDNIVHERCFENHPLKKKVDLLVNQNLINSSPEFRLCKVDGKKILRFEDYVFTGMLTSESADPLYEFNFITINKQNIKNWNCRVKFLDVLLETKKGNNWENPTDMSYLDHLIKIISLSPS